MAKTEEQQQRSDGVSRMMNGEAPPREKAVNDPEAPGTSPGADSVGVSTTRRGEDVKGEDGTEPGREDTGTKGATNRPTGSSDARDSTGVDPQGNANGGAGGGTA